MEEERVVTGVLFEFPFPIRGNVLFAAPSTAAAGRTGFQSWVETAVVSLVQASAGRAPPSSSLL
jgi:hypothetical protein